MASTGCAGGGRNAARAWLRPRQPGQPAGACDQAARADGGRTRVVPEGLLHRRGLPQVLQAQLAAHALFVAPGAVGPASGRRERRAGEGCGRAGGCSGSLPPPGAAHHHRPSPLAPPLLPQITGVACCAGPHSQTRACSFMPSRPWPPPPQTPPSPCRSLADAGVLLHAQRRRHAGAGGLGVAHHHHLAGGRE